jgi:hypothetical protein
MEGGSVSFASDMQLRRGYGRELALPGHEVHRSYVFVKSWYEQSGAGL